MKFPTALVFLVVCLVSLARASTDEARDLVRERLNRKLSRNRYGDDEQVRIEYGGEDGPRLTRFSVLSDSHCVATTGDLGANQET